MKLTNSISRVRQLTLITSIFLFAFSLTQNAYYTTADSRGGAGTQSLSLLLIGWLGIFAGQFSAIAWLANPLLLIAWVLLFDKPIFALVASALVLFFMLSFLTFDKVVVNEAGGLAEITHYGIGYWLWVASDASLIIGNGYSFLLRKRALIS
ncbi:hypothetical protein GO988_12585 [Hymenobacter sp. HMF4947]|uniref:Uncharacterized protein n=1 Tax=Hymenobacter ginkgonis TaxID=2682976 RepID=A0A7K1TFH6_9BACT|nr:hypothetical protein [Hymenobacter ginkgonis]MVN77164.1 hypothetical protein [Hymenobacter ginkgonis]